MQFQTRHDTKIWPRLWRKKTYPFLWPMFCDQGCLQPPLPLVSLWLYR